MIKRKPNKRPTGAGFSWGRKTEAGVTRWLLFRRDHARKVHQSVVEFGESADPWTVARTLRAAKKRLRDQVDEIDLREKHGVAV
jgi:hypothetical protein